MKILATDALAALASGEVAIVQMVYLGFSTTPIALNLSTWDLDWAGVTYKGAAGIGAISAMTDKPGEVQGITLTLFGEAAMIALALDDADIVQGTPCIIRTAIIRASDYKVLEAPIEWVGALDTMAIGEDGNQASINVTAESGAVDLLRGNPSYYNDPDQRSINSTDASFKFVVDQIDKPMIWPAKAFFYQ